MLEGLLQTLAIGLSQGATYALIALGYTMVYGVLGMINFAHGEVFMLGAYAGILVMAAAATLGIPLSPALLLSLAVLVAAGVCAAHGMAVERLAYRPLRRSHALTPLISAIGVSFFLQHYVELTQGKADRTFPHAVQEAVDSSGIILGTAVLCMAGLHLFVTRTRAGTAIRAVSQDPVMASLVGIDVNRTIAWTFALGSALAGVAGVLVTLNYGSAKPSMGYLAGLKAFTAAVLGGIGSIQGAMLGGILLGVVEALGGRYLPVPECKDGLAFLILLGVLLLRPSGLMGEKTLVKV